VLERLSYGVRGDLVERDAPKLRLRDLDDVCEVPRDRLTFAVEVGGEPDVLGGLRLAAQRAGVLLRVVRDDVLRNECLEVHAHL